MHLNGFLSVKIARKLTKLNISWRLIDETLESLFDQWLLASSGGAAASPGGAAIAVAAAVAAAAVVLQPGGCENKLDFFDFQDGS